MTRSKWLNWRVVAFLFALVVLGYAVQTAVNASHSARDATNELRAVETARANADRARALGTCKSSTDLRALWTDMKDILFPESLDVQIRNPETLARIRRARARVDSFTSTNPNCQHVPKIR